jgi:hypothetical protein
VCDYIAQKIGAGKDILPDSIMRELQMLRWLFSQVLKPFVNFQAMILLSEQWNRSYTTDYRYQWVPKWKQDQS